MGLLADLLETAPLPCKAPFVPMVGGACLSATPEESAALKMAEKCAVMTLVIGADLVLWVPSDVLVVRAGAVVRVLLGAARLW